MMPSHVSPPPPASEVYLKPPSMFLATITKQIEDYTAQLPANATGAVVGVATRLPNGTVTTNAAVVARTADGKAAVVGWVGKKWGDPIDNGVEAGGGFKWVW